MAGPTGAPSLVTTHWLGLYQLVIDRRLIPMGSAGSDALAMKNSGHYGAGKSYPLFTALKLYPIERLSSDFKR